MAVFLILFSVTFGGVVLLVAISIFFLGYLLGFTTGGGE